MNKLSLILRKIIFALPLFFIVFSCKNIVPTIIFTSPSLGQEYFKDENIEVRVILTDTKDKDFTVRLEVDDRFIGELPNPPYHFTITKGELPPGVHNIKVKTDGAEDMRTITIKEANMESPDFVTFTNGIIPPEWSTKEWKINRQYGVDDNFSIATNIKGAKVTTYKRCNKISFYLEGNGTVKLLMDGKLWHTIVQDSIPVNPSNPVWRLYEFYCTHFRHTFAWEFDDNLPKYASLDAIHFEIIDE